MNRSVTLPLLSLLALTCAALAFFIYGSPEFPQRIAVHFDLSGRADGWTDKLTFLVIGSALCLMLPVFVVTCLGVLPRILPVALVNVPNRDYWLAPERRDAALGGLMRQALWLGCLIQGLLLSFSWLAVRLSLASSTPSLGSRGVWVLGLFLAGVIIWAVSFLRSFRIASRTSAP